MKHTLPPTNRHRARACHDPRAGRRCAGLTLIELTISLTLLTLVFAAMASVIALASRSLALANADREHAKANAAVAQMVFDARYAVRIVDRSANHVTLEVPDRDNDSITELIRYAWNPTPGSPLTRKYNAEAPVVVVEDVDSLLITFHDMSGSD